jgi:uncharacterized protein (TIGR02680 family)
MAGTVSLLGNDTETFDRTPARHHPHRWRLSRAGFVNVWHYYENTFAISGGRLILRGTNGSGKSRALEMLLPFLLDADRRNMGAGSSVRMEDLMSAGAGEQSNRLGYMWLELCRDPDPAEADEAGPRWLTLGALVRFSVSTKDAKVWYFSTPLRVGSELPLLGSDRQPLSRRELGELVGEERITDVPEKHRERVRTEVFGLTGHLGRERFDGLVKLLHTLRSPDVGNRIEEGRLPAILADALPPLSEAALTDAGQQLDGLTSTREDQRRLEAARDQVRTFLDAYRRYVTGVLTASIATATERAAAVREAERETRRLADQAESLERRHTAKQARLEELGRELAELEATLEALKDSEEYRSLGELTSLTTIVESLASAADSALRAAGELRAREAERVAGADTLAGDVAESAAAVTDVLRDARDLLADVGLPDSELPPALHIHREAVPRRADVIRIGRVEEPEEQLRPAADRLIPTPDDLDALIATARAVRQAAKERSAQAGNRAVDARALAEEQRRASDARRRAEEAAARAREDAEAAQERAERRDDAALDLIDRWRAWLADPATVDLLGISDWSGHPLLGAALADRTALCGEPIDGVMPLRDLDRSAEDAATAARDTLTGALNRLTGADQDDRHRIGALTDERHRLEARDPDPTQPFWVTAPTGTPLWRCVDFADHVSTGDRAGIEAALLASGLLTAVVDGQGQVTAADGQLLVSPLGPPVRAPLTGVLVPEPEAPIPAETITTVLARVAVDDRAAATWIGRDGGWGNGPLRGRHSVPAARHIGAAARAAARAQRLAEIAVEVAELETAIRDRQHERDRIEGRQRALRTHLGTAPRSERLAEARTLALAALRQAGKTARVAQELGTAADQATRAYLESERRHQRACAQFGLPADERSLTKVRDRATDAAGRCQDVAARTATVDGLRRRHAAAVAEIGPVTARRAGAERDAGAAWDDWNAAATRLSILRESVGAATATIERQVNEAASALKTAKAEARTTSTQAQDLGRAAATASAEATGAAKRAGELRSALWEQVSAVLNQMGQPGVTETAFAAAPEGVFTDVAPDAVDADAARLIAGLRRARSDENALMRAQQAFERDISGSYDVSATVAAGVRLFELIDADGRRPLVRAAAEIARQCERGRAALTEREQQVFTEFVLGEVGEELRRRLAQAGSLIKAMNNSLRSIQTSHGIGVRLTWRLSDEASGDVARIKELITTAASVRTASQDAELTGLLSNRVAAEAVADPGAGYATHLRAALDYRAWHVVEVVITGPEPGRERRISRRAKLSQGETRFVSYVTLFAAIDAYLSGLENTAMSLRLILLDDAFAKVDEPTIAELLGLLVRLDVDFAMTGHALWGCVPQIPALDIYEICREDGTPAATAHVHWDGRNRHFLRST